MRLHPTVLAAVLLTLALAVAAAAGPRKLEFTAVEGVTDAKLADAKEAIKVGTMTHAKHGELELWCASKKEGGQYQCKVHKVSGEGAGPKHAAAVSVAAPFIPGGQIVANIMGSDDGRTGSVGTGSFLDK